MSPQDSPSQHTNTHLTSSSSALDLPKQKNKNIPSNAQNNKNDNQKSANKNGTFVSVSSVDNTNNNTGGIMGFMRKHTRQVVTVGVIALVGVTMVALISFNPKGLIRKNAGDRSYNVDSKQKIPSAEDAQKASLILRIGSMCVITFSFMFNLIAFMRCKKSYELLVFNIVLGVLVIYQIFAIALL